MKLTIFPFILIIFHDRYSNKWDDKPKRLKILMHGRKV